MTEYSVNVEDWQNEKWSHIGTDLMYNYYLEDKETIQECKDNDWDIDTIVREKSDSHYPMMLYAYPLNFEPDDDKIIKVCTRTNCTVVENTESNEYFLALSGGGMNLSQDIGLAYLILEGRIPTALLFEISTQPELSIYGKDWLKLMRAIKRQLRNTRGSATQRARKINTQINNYKATLKARREERERKRREKNV